MASNKSSNGGGGYEVLKNLNTGNETYIPGDKITGLKKEQADDLLLKEVIGKVGSFKKQQAEAELLGQGGSGNIEDILDLVKELKNEIQELKQENKGLRETAAKK